MKYGRKSLTMILSLALVLFSLASVEAKWWIFGQSEDNVEISYLFINKASFDETGAKITLFKEMLPDGKVTINGKAVAGKGKIGSVRISLDGKETWRDANLSESGVFEFSFKPEMGKTYAIFIEISDTTGKTNDVAATARQVVLSDRNVRSFIIEALDKMIAAYEGHDPKAFMVLVSEDFAGDMTNLDRAIRKDFNSFDDIDLNYTLNNITSDSKGISVSLNYRRSLVSTKTGQSLKDKGVTEFVFKMGDKGAKVYSMKNPLIFGVSDAPNVATGMVEPMTNDPIIVVDSKGNVKTVPPQQFKKIVNGEDDTPSATVEGRNITLNSQVQNPPAQPSGFSFIDGQVIEGRGDFLVAMFWESFLAQNVFYQDLGNVSINTINEAPAAGYTGGMAQFQQGHSYAFKLANGKYGLIYITSYDEPMPHTVRMIFSYKYQTNGTRQFLP